MKNTAHEPDLFAILEVTGNGVFDDFGGLMPAHDFLSDHLDVRAKNGATINVLGWPQESTIANAGGWTNFPITHCSMANFTSDRNGRSTKASGQ